MKKLLIWGSVAAVVTVLTFFFNPDVLGEVLVSTVFFGILGAIWLLLSWVQKL